MSTTRKPAKRTGRDADPRRTLKLNTMAWQRLRASVLSAEPLCRHCTARGLTVVATDVDHADGNPGNNDIVNLHPLCHECHSRKTQRDMGHKVNQGCDVHGNPIGAHHWNEPAVGGSDGLAGPVSTAIARDFGG